MRYFVSHSKFSFHELEKWCFYMNNEECCRNIMFFYFCVTRVSYSTRHTVPLYMLLFIKRRHKRTCNIIEWFLCMSIVGVSKYSKHRRTITSPSGSPECAYDVIRSPFIARGVASPVIERTNALHPNTRFYQFNVCRGWTKISLVLFPARESWTLIDWKIVSFLNYRWNGCSWC